LLTAPDRPAKLKLANLDWSPIMRWSLSEAKNRLSEVLTLAESQGPQIIQRRDKIFVLMPQSQCEKLAGKSPTFEDWLLKGPRIDDLELPARKKSKVREVDL